MHGPTCLDYVEPGGIHETAKFLCRAKHGHAPGRITKPTADTAVCCPKAPAPEFAND